MKILNFVLFICFFGCASQNRLSSSRCDEIVIVNIGVHSRAGIARQIDYIESLEPKVIAIDALFPIHYNKYQDSILVAALDKCRNLVMAIELPDVEPKLLLHDSTETLLKFLPHAKKGFINALLEEDSLPVQNKISVYDKISDSRVYHFAAATAMAYDSLRALDFIKKKEQIITVNYLGNKDVFNVISAESSLERTISKDRIKGKIVLLGYVGPFDNYPFTKDEDMIYSPLNPDPKNGPDMYGVIFLANVICQILGK